MVVCECVPEKRLIGRIPDMEFPEILPVRIWLTLTRSRIKGR